MPVFAEKAIDPGHEPISLRRMLFLELPKSLLQPSHERPQRRGWVVLEQVDGKTDINSVRVVWYDAEAA